MVLSSQNPYCPITPENVDLVQILEWGIRTGLALQDQAFPWTWKVAHRTVVSLLFFPNPDSRYFTINPFQLSCQLVKARWSSVLYSRILKRFRPKRITSKFVLHNLELRWGPNSAFWSNTFISTKVDMVLFLYSRSFS